jgi:hypothetical protein
MASPPALGTRPTFLKTEANRVEKNSSTSPPNFSPSQDQSKLRSSCPSLSLRIQISNTSFSRKTRPDQRRTNYHLNRFPAAPSDLFNTLKNHLHVQPHLLTQHRKTKTNDPNNLNLYATHGCNSPKLFNLNLRKTDHYSPATSSSSSTTKQLLFQ